MKNVNVELLVMKYLPVQEMYKADTRKRRTVGVSYIGECCSVRIVQPRPKRRYNLQDSTST